jgi:hypothetical protein
MSEIVSRRGKTYISSRRGKTYISNFGSHMAAKVSLIDSNNSIKFHGNVICVCSSTINKLAT